MKTIVLLLAVSLLALGCVVPGGEAKALAGYQAVLAKYGLGADAFMPAHPVDVLGFESEMKAVKEAAGASGSAEGRALEKAADIELDVAAALKKMFEGREHLKVVGIIAPDCSKDGAAGKARAAFEEAATRARLALEKKKILEKDFANFMDRFAGVAGPDFDRYVAYLAITNTAAAKQLESRCRK
ncbi:MAG: hypothetical protein J4203_04345 [Candidatus Diapherotrites archaeon]|uniref:Uncharacterized protein n=1 Tax=Candidatus Iainarchaeum sp. TaxID=3101447 RepID=A0A8T4L729_9ARCH|nr:hypothetical protein [Candidatus Diapherotrites archaeon]